MEKCPNCGSTNTKPLKEWEMKNPKSGNTKVILYLCGDCGKKFRKGLRIA